jgi:anti-anti-sigma factor
MDGIGAHRDRSVWDSPAGTVASTVAGQPPVAAPDPGAPTDAESWVAMVSHQMNLSITRALDTSVDCVQILGDVDLSDAHALALAADQLIEGDASEIYVDLGGTTFMGSTLVTFLVLVGEINGHARRPMVLCRPTPMARRVIRVTGLDALASVRPDLPTLWPSAWLGKAAVHTLPEQRRDDLS